jgi:hypothetical protein
MRTRAQRSRFAYIREPSEDMMLSARQRLGVGLSGLGLLAVVACGSNGDSTFDDSHTFGGAASSSGSSGDFSSGGASGGASSGASGGASSGGTVTPQCATSSATPQGLPAYLVFMFDRSGSMKDNSKWPSATAALKSFFADPASSGLYASLQFFTQPDECNVSEYAKPAVAMTALPNGPAFSGPINGMSPSGYTPTVPAEQGAIQYAQQVKAGLTHGEKVVVVLVTDGDPNHCATNPNDTAAAAAQVGSIAATVASTIPTYVIGVGPDTQYLNTIAQGGGTGAAIMVATNNPTQITQDLVKAMNQIRSAALGCDYLMPAPPAGKTLDLNGVNVVFTPAGGAAQTLNYSADCADANGWHYDSLTNPTKITMCAGICNTLKASTGKMDIVFGCITQGGGGPGGPGGIR